LKRFLKILAGVFLTLILLLGGLFFYLTTPYFAAKAGTLLTHKSGRNIALKGKIEWHIWSAEPRIVLHDVEIGNAPWSKTRDLFSADTIDCAIKLSELFKLRLVMTELKLDHPQLTLEKNEQGQANWDFTQNPQEAVLKKAAPQSRHSFPIIRRLEVRDGLLTYRDPKKEIDTSLHVSTAQAKGAEDAIAFKGNGSYRRQPFFLEARGASVLQLRDADTPYPIFLDTRIGDTYASVNGTVKDPVKMEAFDVVLHLRGKNAADLFPLTGIALPPTPPYAIQGRLTRDGYAWKFNRFSGTLGHSDLKGDILWDPAQQPPYFKGDFTSRNLDIADLSGFIGAHQKPEDASRVLPDVPLDISRLKAMNADATLRGQHIQASDVLDDFSMNLSLKDGILRLHPVSFGIADGRISANLTVHGHDNPPRIESDVSFNRLSLARLFAPLAKRFGKENVSAGALGGKATLSGQGKSLRDMFATADGTIGIGMEGGKLSELLLELAGLDLFRASGLLIAGDAPVEIGCVVGDFGVDHGVMRTKEMLIDTKVSTIQGSGTIDLRNETMNLRFEVHSKKPSLFSARSPLLLRGDFKHPRPGVDAAALAERGGAAGLLALLAPPAALLAFIEPGLGKDSHCASFISRMNQDTGSKVPHHGDGS
jgi:uncharacterized protein involved in outer membrane biogenesis